MGNNAQARHPEMKFIRSAQDLKECVGRFNKLNQDQLIDRLGYKIAFRPTFRTREESIATVIIGGTIEIGDRVQQIQMKLHDMLELKDMIGNLGRDSVVTPVPVLTPTPTPTSGDDHLCCICMDNRVDRMLPCTHCFCSQCTQKYIMDKEEKICPRCRADFSEKQDMNKKIVDIFDNQEEMMRIILNNVRELLVRTNPHLSRLL